MLREQPQERCRLPGGGKKVIDPLLEIRLAQYVNERKAREEKITFTMIRKEAARIWEELRHENPHQSEYSNSKGHVSRFCTRHQIVFSAKGASKGDNGHGWKQKEQDHAHMPVDLGLDDAVGDNDMATLAAVEEAPVLSAEMLLRSMTS